MSVSKRGKKKQFGNLLSNYFLVPKPHQSTSSFHVDLLSCSQEMQHWRRETTEITDRSDMGKINLVQFSQTFKIERFKWWWGFMTSSGRASNGNAGAFWHFSEQVGRVFFFFSSPFPLRSKWKQWKAKVSCKVPLRETNEMRLPYNQKS